jgi:hypothetical protein
MMADPGLLLKGSVTLQETHGTVLLQLPGRSKGPMSESLQFLEAPERVREAGSVWVAMECRTD